MPRPHVWCDRRRSIMPPQVLVQGAGAPRFCGAFQRDGSFGGAPLLRSSAGNYLYRSVASSHWVLAHALPGAGEAVAIEEVEEDGGEGPGVLAELRDSGGVKTEAMEIMEVWSSARAAAEGDRLEAASDAPALLGTALGGGVAEVAMMSDGGDRCGWSFRANPGRPSVHSVARAFATDSCCPGFRHACNTARESRIFPSTVSKQTVHALAPPPLRANVGMESVDGSLPTGEQPWEGPGHAWTPLRVTVYRERADVEAIEGSSTPLDE